MARDPQQGGAAWEGSTLFLARIGTLNPVWRGALASGTAPWMMVADTRPCRRPAFRLMRRSHDFDAVHWDHEPRTSRKVPPTRCCRRLVGRASLRFLCRQDAGSTLVFMESPDAILGARWNHGTLCHSRQLERLTGGAEHANWPARKSTLAGDFFCSSSLPPF